MNLLHTVSANAARHIESWPSQGSHDDTSASLPESEPSYDSDSDFDSLFDEPLDESVRDYVTAGCTRLSRRIAQYSTPARSTDSLTARRVAPPVPGLYFDPRVLLPDELENRMLQTCMNTYFVDEHVNQGMLFERVPPTAHETHRTLPVPFSR